MKILKNTRRKNRLIRILKETNSIQLRTVNHQAELIETLTGELALIYHAHHAKEAASVEVYGKLKADHKVLQARYDILKAKHEQ